jgi:hypothetical protein
MRPLWTKFLRHAVIVGGTLAVVGYLLGRGFLLAQKMYGGGAYTEENERVLWQTPIVMASLGIIMTGSIDLLGVLLRRPAPVPVSAIPPSDPGT